MLTLSRKATIMPASPIRKLIPYSEAAKKRGIKVYHLNIGQPDVPSPKEAINAVKNATPDFIPYPHSAGIESYRKGLAKYYQAIGIDVTYEDINITTGGSEALQIALAITCNPDDEVIVMEPFYTNYNSFAVQNDVKYVAIPTKIEDGFALPPISEFEKYITPRTKGIIVTNPGNPTGTLYPKEAVMELGELAKKHNIFLFADEVYREFCYTDEPHFSCMHLKGVEENVILLDSVSKRYSLCGVRIGCIVSKNKQVMNAVLRYAQARLCSPAYGQIAAEGALDTPKEYFEMVRKEYMDRRDFTVSALNSMEGVFCPNPMGAFYVVAELPIDDSEKFAQWLLEDFDYEKKTVMVAPAGGFYSNYELGKKQVRIAYVLKIEDLKEAMMCFEAALKQYPGRTIK